MTWVMKRTGHIIGEKEQANGMLYNLFNGFDAAGNPLYKSGATNDATLLRAIKESIDAAQKMKNQYSVVSMGDLTIALMSGRNIKIGLVYDQAAGMYTNLIYHENILCKAGGRLPYLLESLKNNKPGA